MAKPTLRSPRLGIEHPREDERARGEKSRVVLRLATLGGGVIRQAEITEDELLVLIRDAASFLSTLRKVNS